MALVANWTTPHEFVDGELLTKTLMNAMEENILHLASRPDSFDSGTQSGQTATGTTFTSISDPTITVTPKITGNLLLIGTICLTHSAGGANALVRFDINGSKSGSHASLVPTTDAPRITIFASFPVTANTAYTVTMEFNNQGAAGTMTAVSGFSAYLYGIEVG